MIARIWNGVVDKSKSDEYYDYLKKTGLKDYSKVDGFLELKVLRRDEGKSTQFQIVTFWDSLESIKEFAGEDYEMAKYYPEDEKYLHYLEPKVLHYNVL